MKATVVCSVLAISTVLSLSAYVLNHGKSVAPVALEPVMEEIGVDTLPATQFEADTMTAFERRHALIMSLPAEGGVHKHRRAVLPMPSMVEYPDSLAERDMYKQMAKERIDAAIERTYGRIGR